MDFLEIKDTSSFPALKDIVMSLFDKGFLAAIILLIGFVLNRSLERYKYGWAHQKTLAEYRIKAYLSIDQILKTLPDSFLEVNKAIIEGQVRITFKSPHLKEEDESKFKEIMEQVITKGAQFDVLLASMGACLSANQMFISDTLTRAIWDLVNAPYYEAEKVIDSKNHKQSEEHLMNLSSIYNVGDFTKRTDYIFGVINLEMYDPTISRKRIHEKLKSIVRNKGENKNKALGYPYG